MGCLLVRSLQTYALMVRHPSHFSKSKIPNLFLKIYSQLQGILFIAYGIAYDFLPNRDFNLHMIILGLAVIAITLSCWLLYKRYPYFAINPKIEK
jgi:hypothetical protein